MSQPATAPTMADNFFLEAMKPAFREDPYPFYERFRGTAPLLRVADTIWFALGHAEVAAMLRHPRLSTDELQHATTKAGKAPDSNRVRSLLFMDAPDHTRLRCLVARAFTPRRIDDLRAATEGITAELTALSSARPRRLSGLESVQPEERAAIDEVAAVEPGVWLALAHWAKETNNLQPWQRSLAFSLGRLIGQGREPSRKQAVQGKRILDEAGRLGFDARAVA